MKWSRENVILRGKFYIVSSLPLHFMLYRGNFCLLFGQCTFPRICGEPPKLEKKSAIVKCVHKCANVYADFPAVIYVFISVLLIRSLCSRHYLRPVEPELKLYFS